MTYAFLKPLLNDFLRSLSAGTSLLPALAIPLLVASCARGDKPLVQVDRTFDVGTLNVVNEAKVALVPQGEPAAVRVEAPKGVGFAGVTFPAPPGMWDLSPYSYVVAQVRNVCPEPVLVRCRVENPGVKPGYNVKFGIHPEGRFVNGTVVLAPGQSGQVQVELRRRKAEWIGADLFGMVCYPWGQCQSSDTALAAGSVEADRIAAVTFYVRKPFWDQAFEIRSIRAVGKYEAPARILKDADRFFPFIDEYGQYLHADWPTKTRTPEDFVQRREEEARDLAAHPGPPGRTRYGGWQDGPALEATGWFRVAKYNGKWWLVDPEGKLFFSHGIDCVSSREGATTIDDREKWFRNLPARNSEFADFFSSRGRAFPRGHYAGRTTTSFDFTRANLLRKYGPDWPAVFADLAHRRLASWGLNTMGNWSDPAIYGQQRTPYTVNVRFRSRPLEAAEGWWGKSPDSFDPDFKEQLRRSMAREAATSAIDPWCLGYFVGNEMEWGLGDMELAKMTLASPAGQAGKKVFIADLKAQYGTIKKLNVAWGTDHASWQALLECTAPPDESKAGNDLVAFNIKTCENYFKTVRDAVKEAAPGHLYLGCRFAGGFEAPTVMGAAARYCDIVSFNLYRSTVENYCMSVAADVPLLVGEYSFWARDCGKFNLGGLSLPSLATQADRAEAYQGFMHSALRHPQLVGCHFFKYLDQPTTGRGDGENFNFGFLDVADTPYPEIIHAARRVAGEMYSYRSQGL